jgi:hypothetical protein
MSTKRSSGSFYPENMDMFIPVKNGIFKPVLTPVLEISDFDEISGLGLQTRGFFSEESSGRKGRPVSQMDTLGVSQVEFMRV